MKVSCYGVNSIGGQERIGGKVAAGFLSKSSLPTHQLKTVLYRDRLCVVFRELVLCFVWGVIFLPSVYFCIFFVCVGGQLCSFDGMWVGMQIWDEVDTTRCGSITAVS